MKTAPVQKGPTAPGPNSNRLLLRGGEVAALLGISRALAFKWMQDGVLPTVRIAGARTVRVPKEALLEWVEQNTGTGLEPSQGRVAESGATKRSYGREETQNAI